MGYESIYTITAEDRRPSCDSILDSLYAALNEKGEVAICRSGGRGKWYHWCGDMLKFSALHPGVLFTVLREGKDPEDIEVGYFLNGDRLNRPARRKERGALTLPEMTDIDRRALITAFPPDWSDE